MDVHAAFAQSTPVGQAREIPGPDTQDQKQKLEHIGGDLKAERERMERLSRDIANLRQNRSELNRQLVDTAKKVQQLEEKISAGEKRFGEFEQTAEKIRISLKSRQNIIAELLSALQRMGRNPPPALLVEPENALKAVRSAILLGAVLPEFTEEANFLARELEDLVRLRKLMAAEIAQLKAQAADIRASREKLGLLLVTRQKEQLESEDELARSQERAEKLASEVTSLKELIERSEKEIAGARRAAEEAAAADASKLMEKDGIAAEAEKIEELREARNPQNRTLAALTNPGRLAPAISFDKAKGLLPLPVSGEALRRFGEKDRYGAQTRGLLLNTRKQAVVTAPTDGWVAYAGPFRAYGLIVIINAGSGYHILLAGLEQSSVKIGQFVLAGEPVGQMGDQSRAAATAVDMASDQPVLYVEFRKNGTVIDPTPWWATTNQKVRS